MIEKEFILSKFDYLENTNILFSNLWTDGFHINDRGTRKYTGNVNKFAIYY